MKKNIYFFFLFIFTLLNSYCLSGQTFQWASTANGFNSAVGAFNGKDSIGNLYVSGSYDNWSTDTTVGIFVMKFTPFGIMEWVQKLPSHMAGLNGFTVDKSGNVSIIGGFGTGGFVKPSNTILTSNSNNMFLIKFNTHGALQFATMSLEGSMAVGENLSSDNLGNLYVIGKFSDKVVLPCDSFTSPAVNHCFVVKYSPTGICLWVKHLISATFDGGGANSKIRTDKNNNSYVSGHFNMYAIFDTITIADHGYQDIFLAKLDASGNFLWAKALGGNFEEISGPMDIDSLGNTYISGYFSSAPAYFDNYTLTTNSYNYFTAKYNTNGNCLWAKYARAGIVCAVNDGFYATTPSFISKYDTLGSLQWTKTVAGANNYAMGADNASLCITGNYTGLVNFDAYSLNSTTDQMFIAKLENPNPPLTTKIKETQNNSIFSVYPNPTGNIIDVCIQSTNSQAVSLLKVSNALSQIVYSETLKEVSGLYSKQIDLGKLPKGIYFVELQSTSSDSQQKKVEVKKIVLQ